MSDPKRILASVSIDIIMAQFWMFVSLPYSDSNNGSMLDLLEKVKVDGKWFVGKKTHYINQLSEGDNALLYEAGEEGRRFVGSAKLLSNVQAGEDSKWVLMGGVEIWNRTVPINEFLDKLSFITKSRNWGLCVRGGIIRLTKKDYEMILSKAKG